MMVRDFHRVIGDRGAPADSGKGRAACPICSSPASAAARMPSACSIRSSRTKTCRMVGVEAGGDGIIPERHAARFQGGKLGVLQGTKTWLLANDDGQIELTHSRLRRSRLRRRRPRARLPARPAAASNTPTPPTTRRSTPSRNSPACEGIIPALESAHAIADVIEKRADRCRKDQHHHRQPLRPRRQGRGAGRAVCVWRGVEVLINSQESNRLFAHSAIDVSAQSHRRRHVAAEVPASADRRAASAGCAAAICTSSTSPAVGAMRRRRWSRWARRSRTAAMCAWSARTSASAKSGRRGRRTRSCRRSS